MVILMFTAADCPADKTYQQCGPACPQTCDFINSDEPQACGLPCVPGCYCPNGQVEKDGICVNSSECRGTECIYICAAYTKLPMSLCKAAFVLENL